MRFLAELRVSSDDPEVRNPAEAVVLAQRARELAPGDERIRELLARARSAHAAERP